MVAESKPECNFLYFHICKVEKFARLLDFKQIEIVYRRHTRFFSEQTAEIGRRIIDEFRHFVKIKLFVQIAFHEIDCALHHVLCLGLVDFTKLRNKPERSQKIPQTHRNIFHVFDAVTHFQIDQNFIEELYAVGKDIQITKQEMKNHEKRFALGEEDAQDSVTDDGKSSEEKAFQALVRRKTLAVAAETAGYTVSDAELDQIVSEKREAMDTGIDDPENKEYGETLKALYDSFGGEDQYWEYMREETRTSAEIEKYFADKEKEYKEQLGSDGETAQTWDEAREELVDQLIAEQDVKTV